MVRRLVDPNQVDTSNEFLDILSPVALRRLQESWQHLFRRVILELGTCRDTRIVYNLD